MLSASGTRRPKNEKLCSYFCILRFKALKLKNNAIILGFKALKLENKARILIFNALDLKILPVFRSLRS